ncbi:ATP-binding cassette [Thecamonas trahens ATCC 50062]|uniref:ATP-binding cassette n=1 Tax=Thecamonas trahens ATCC 50062 TaxID=461836 RepID=A0A0L0DND4_THETB|nr:ATP-binding cassette [Thecamonas trahens ATCC 50062]KNC53822.1 ATP-binding cassette [Thecamonas trahens ATCC 50062]|eukprot:XP_013754207.1 ATP-binding cassette [Thecamonas trahens ATCC 50062]
MGNTLSKVMTTSVENDPMRNVLGNSLGAQVMAGASVVAAVGFVLKLAQKAAKRQTPTMLFAPKGSESSKSSKVAVDGKFFNSMSKIMKTLVPSLFSPEAAYMVVVAVSMVARTYCDVWMLNNGTAIERCIITGDAIGFKTHLFKLILAMLPLSVTNNLLKYGLWELALRFRTRLTNKLYKSYLADYTYYQVSNLDNRISNADQLLTTDVLKFCDSVAELYSNIAKPLLDIVIYSRALTDNIGLQGPVVMLGYLVLSGVVLTRLRRPTGAFTVQEQRLEGEFRYVNSRLITHSEEIAFYNGNKREEITIASTFSRLVTHLRNALQFRGLIGLVDNVVAKYLATVVGFLVMSRGFLARGSGLAGAAAQSENMEAYYRAGRMLVNLAKAMGRLVLAGRELTRLAGFTNRVTDLDRVLKDLAKGKYVRTMIAADNGAGASAESSDAIALAPNSGEIVNRDHVIIFDKVPIVTPNGDVLIRSMSFAVEAGKNVLVCGPNGCGKSSLFRTLGGLWPLFGGKMTKPTKDNLFYIPQRPYLTLGTLRDQIIYPHTAAQFYAAGHTDDDLLGYLDHVHLAYIVTREGGWDTVADWADVLSGGEKQRVAMARLFYHRPQFAILDECTSAVSVDVEGFMYEHCRSELGITLFTVSHRKSLWKYHDYVLAFDGRGGYSFSAIADLDPAEHGS